MRSSVITALLVVWVVAACAVFRLHRESLRLFVVVSTLWFVFKCLSRAPRTPGSKSAYYTLNDNFEKLDGELHPTAFGPAHKGRSGGIGAGTTVGSRCEPMETDEGFCRMLVYSTVKLHHKCPCMSGKRFASCCQPLRDKLRQLGS